MPASRTRRVGLLVALVVAALLVGFLIQLPRDRVSSLPVGRLSVASDVRGTYAVGDLSVDLAEDRMRILRGDREVWASEAGKPFAVAGRGQVGWQEHRGYLWPHTQRTERLRHQQVTGVRVTGAAVELTGVFGSGPAAPAWTATIRADGAGAALHLAAAEVDSIALVSGRTPDAAVHGLGEQFAGFDLSGRVIPIVTREQGVGRGVQPLTLLADLTNAGAGATDQFTYAAWPSYVTADLTGVRLQPGAAGTDAFVVADTTGTRRVSLEVWGTELTAQLVAADSPAELLEQRKLTGAAEPPDWLYQGAVLGIQGGSEKVRASVAAARDAGAVVSGVWLQDWTGRRTTSFGDRLWWTWQVDRELYPDWEELVAELHAEGIRTTSYVNAFVVNAAPKQAESKQDEGIRNLYAEAAAAGHLVLGPDGGPYLMDQGEFDAAMVDLSRPESREWYAQVIASEVLAHGVDGFMADFGEGPPPDARPAGGGAEDLHNAWPTLWAQTVARACEIAERPDCATWFRVGSSSTPEHAALLWNGDQLVTTDPDDGLASALLGTFHAGVSGWPLAHADLGGYTSINAVVHDYVRAPELLARWGEFAAFGVVMRSHEGNRPGPNPQVYDPEELAAYARNTQIFAALEPYRKEVVREARQTGMPAIRHAWLMAPGSRAAERDDQFFFGPDVFLAPVLDLDAEEVEVTLPPGQWRHLFTGEVYAGDTDHTVAAPIGHPAAFVRADSPWAGDLIAAMQAI
ncbi:alpha-glucosidase [Parenemella sanctibonifatiensis]|uniref:alpha-glucosidase n=1 Tax=Parenemella sanctibonifatiensis TaxID=2016505 RepID=UPI0015C5C8A9|nr:alpha-glucosidase [Parenemella sanctibonifatiensis]